MDDNIAEMETHPAPCENDDKCLEQNTQRSLMDHFTAIEQRIETTPAYQIYGSIVRISGFLLEATGLNASVGMLCYVVMTPKQLIPAEVIGFANQKTYLMAYQETL